MKTLPTILLALSISTILGTGNIMAQAPEIEWQKSLGGSAGESATSIQQTADGGYIMAGYSESNDGDVTGNHGDYDYWVVKVNATGVIEWQKSLGGSGTDMANAVQQTLDGGYIVVGQSNSNNGDVTGNHGSYDFWVVKLNAAGAITWQKSFGGSIDEEATAVQQTTDGGYIVAGKSDSQDGDVIGNQGFYDFWILKLTQAGTIAWQKSLGGSQPDISTDIQQTTDGGYIVCGSSASTDGDVTGNHGSNDFWVAKLNNTGNIEWQKSLGGTEYDTASSVQQTVDGGYIVAGQVYSNDGDVTGHQGGTDYWVVRLDSTGNMEWQKAAGGSSSDTAMDVLQSMDGGFLVSGTSSSTDGDITENQGGIDYWTVKLLETGAIDWEKSLGGSESDWASSNIQVTGGGYVIAGRSSSIDGDVTGNHGGEDFWVVKLFPDVLGVEAFDNQISVYPNPVSSVLNIATNEPITSVSVFNQLGQQVMVSSHFDKTLQLDMSGLAANLYFVVVNTEKSRETFKIVVQ